MRRGLVRTIQGEAATTCHVAAGPTNAINQALPRRFNCCTNSSVQPQALGLSRICFLCPPLPSLMHACPPRCRKLRGPFNICRVSVRELSLQWPSWRKPLSLHVHGVCVEFQQKQMPEARGGPLLRSYRAGFVAQGCGWRDVISTCMSVS